MEDTELVEQIRSTEATLNSLLAKAQAQGISSRVVLYSMDAMHIEATRQLIQVELSKVMSSSEPRYSSSHR